MLVALFCLAVAGGGPTPPQTVEPPELRAAVEHFFAAQEAEDVDGYLALWSKRAQRPHVHQLKYVFDSGDDKYTDITLGRIIVAGDRARVRVSAVRERTPAKAPPGTKPFVNATSVALTFVREEGEWKLLREGTPATDLAGALIDAVSPEERAELLTAEQELVGPMLLRAISEQASLAAQRAAYAEAERLFTLVIEVARKAEDRAAEGQAFQNLANTFYFRRRLAEALAAYEQRLAIERERKDDEAIASALLGIATVRYAYTEYGDALAAYREALALFEQLGDEPAIATALISTGNVLYLQGDYDAAIADYRRSRELSRKTANSGAESRALEGLGRVFTAQGDFAAALDAFTGVLAEAKAKNDRGTQATALQHIGEIQFKLANLDEARSSFGASRAHYEARNDPANVGRLWQAIALTDLVAARFEPAEKEYTISIGVCGGAQDQECVARATVGLAFAQAAQQKYTHAIATYAKAIDAFTALGRHEEAARAEVGKSQAYAGKGDLDAALASAGRARQTAIALGADDVLWRALLSEARVLRRKGDPAAPAAAQTAVATVERLRNISVERPGNAAPADGDSAFATLAVIQAENADAASALATSERMRLYRLRTTLGPHERDIARGATPEEREEERAAAAQLISIDAQLSRERSLPKPDRARIERLGKALADAIARRREQQRRLFERLPELRAWRALGRPAEAADLERLLGAPDSALLDFVADEDDLLTIVAVRGEAGIALAAYVTPLGERALADRITALLQPAVVRTRQDWDRLAAEFVATLPPDAFARVSAASMVIVVPDAGFWRLPFEALPLHRAPGGEYLSDCMSVSYSSSLTAALQARELNGRIPVRPLVAVAAPEIPASVRDRIASTAPGWALRDADAARTEVGKLLALEEGAQQTPDGPAVLTGGDATEARIRERAPEALRLHFASPFRVNAASPLFSPLLLGGAGVEPPNDGALEAREVMNLDLAATLVVLSDGAALGMRDAAHGLDAIEWTWRSAGVSSLLLTRWLADAGASEPLLAEFHRRTAAGAPPRDALRAARAKVRAEAATRAPFYWAGWLLIEPPLARER